LGDGHSQLVEAVSGREDGEAAAESDLAAGGEAGRDADHVLLGDAYREEAVRKLLSELDDRGRVAEVGIDADDVEPLAAETGERRAEGGSGGFGAGGLDHQAATSRAPPVGARHP